MGATTRPTSGGPTSAAEMLWRRRAPHGSNNGGPGSGTTTDGNAEASRIEHGAAESDVTPQRLADRWPYGPMGGERNGPAGAAELNTMKGLWVHRLARERIGGEHVI